MEIYNTIEFYINYKTAYLTNQKLLESYIELIRLAKAKYDKQALKYLHDNLNKSKAGIDQYKNMIIESFAASTKEQRTEILNYLRTILVRLEALIAEKELELTQMSINGRYLQYIGLSSNALIKPNVVPQEYYEKERELENMKIRYNTYNNIVYYLNALAHTATKKP